MQVVPTALQRSKEEIEMEKIAIQKERLRIQKKEQKARNIKTALGIAGAIGTAALGLYMAKEKIRVQDGVTAVKREEIEASKLKNSEPKTQLPPTSLVRDAARATVDASVAARNIGTLVPKTGLGKAATIGTLVLAGSTVAPDVVSTGVNYGARNVAESLGKTVTRLPVTVVEGIFSGAKEGLQETYKSYHPDQAVPHAALRGGKDPEWVVTGGVRGIGHYQKPPSAFNVLMNDKLPGTNTTIRDIIQSSAQAIQYDAASDPLVDPFTSWSPDPARAIMKPKNQMTHQDWKSFGALNRDDRTRVNNYWEDQFQRTRKGYGKTRK